MLARWQRLPLYVRIVIGLGLGVIVGLVLGRTDAPWAARTLAGIAVPADLVLRLLGALAPPLIFLAVIRAVLTADVRGRDGRRLGWLLLSNTLVAIVVGLVVAGTVRPGTHGNPPASQPAADPAGGEIANPAAKLLEQIPTSLLKPLVDGNPVGAILVALGLGLAFRTLDAHRPAAAAVAAAGFDAVVVLLHWVIALVPLAIFCKIASLVGTEGFAKFARLGWFVAAVLVALLIQVGFYMTRLRLGSWVRPPRLIGGIRDALVMAFSTASSTATVPVTYAAMTDRVGVRPKSADLGVMVGSNFNNDGTALYEAMSALFVAQLLGIDLSIGQQVLVVLTSVIASVGAAGIPEAGLVTMTLVFHAVGLPVTMIPLLLTVDWFLDRCRTAVNVLADATVCCLMDGKTPADQPVGDGRPVPSPGTPGEG